MNYKIFYRMFRKNQAIVLSKNLLSYTDDNAFTAQFNFISNTRRGGVIFHYVKNTYQIGASGEYFGSIPRETYFNITTTNYFIKHYSISPPGAFDLTFYESQYLLEISNNYTNEESSYARAFLKYTVENGIKFKSSHFSSVNATDSKIIIYTTQDLSLYQFNINAIGKKPLDKATPHRVDVFTDRIEITLKNTSKVLVNNSLYDLELINIEDPA